MKNEQLFIIHGPQPEQEHKTWRSGEGLVDPEKYKKANATNREMILK
jgi:hypothetical protein